MRGVRPNLTVTDVFTGWTEIQTVRNKAQKGVFAALVDLHSAFPVPELGIDSDYAGLVPEVLSWQGIRAGGVGIIR